MRQAFVFIETTVTLEPASPRSKLGKIHSNIASRSVVVTTPEMVGSGVILGERIITSLFLVGNFTMVKILLSKGKQMPAFVGRRDSKNNLAELEPAHIRSKDDKNDHLEAILRGLKDTKICESEPCQIGSPLFVSNSRRGLPRITLASMKYNNRFGENFENVWKIDSTAPKGLMGSAVWSENGKLKGLALAAMIPPSEHFLEAARQRLSPEQRRKSLVVSEWLTGPNVYAAPATAVLDFLETK